MSFELRRAVSRLMLGLGGLCLIASAGCSDSSTEPTPQSTDSFSLTRVDNIALPALLWPRLGGSIQLEGATLKPKEAGKMMDVRVFREVFPGGFQLTRDSTVVNVEVQGSRWIIHRPHPNPSLAYTDTGTVSEGVLTVPTTLDYRATKGVDLKRVQLVYTVEN